MNHLAGRGPLANRYFVMRHGRSRPNAAGLIVSDPGSGCRAEAGLSAAGRAEVTAAVTTRPAGLGPATVVLCSEFSRAIQSAAIVCRGLQAAPARTDWRLRERAFGELEGGPDQNYELVWAADGVDGSHQLLGVESADAVLDRTTGLVVDLEQRARDATFLLVSHGDVLQILQCGFAGLAAGQHRAVSPLHTAELRELRQSRAT
jgi:broad specificity phosphatase PhoE